MKATTATLLEPSHLFTAFSEDTLPTVSLSTLLLPKFPPKESSEVSSTLDISFEKLAVNYLALMGWSYDDHTEIFSMMDLIEKFDIHRVHVASAKFSPDKLEWTNAYYINHILTEEDFARRSIPFLVNIGLISQEYAQDEFHFEYIKKACTAEQIQFAFLNACVIL